MGWTAGVRAVRVVRVVRVVFRSVLFCLPRSCPVTPSTMNQAVAALAGALLLATAYRPFARRVGETRTHANSPRDIRQMEDIVRPWGPARPSGTFVRPPA